jgi:hypothetical protein
MLRGIQVYYYQKWRGMVMGWTDKMDGKGKWLEEGKLIRGMM